MLYVFSYVLLYLPRRFLNLKNIRLLFAFEYIINLDSNLKRYKYIY